MDSHLRGNDGWGVGRINAALSGGSGKEAAWITCVLLDSRLRGMCDSGLRPDRDRRDARATAGGWGVADLFCHEVAPGSSLGQVSAASAAPGKRRQRDDPSPPRGGEGTERANREIGNSKWADNPRGEA